MSDGQTSGPELVGRRVGHSSSSAPICPNPVFVIGSPRSGTTALAKSLGEHSELWASGESQLFSDLFVNGLVERAFDHAMRSPGPTLFRIEGVSREEFRVYVGVGLNALITNRSEGRRWIDHTPVYALIADTLADVFPGASFIHILRDGRSVVHSMLNFTKSRRDPAVARFTEQTIAWATDMGLACDEWRDHVEAALRFRRGHSGRVMTVRYEDLMTAPEASFRSIYRFLHVAVEDRPARFFASRRTNSSFQERLELSPAELWESWEEEPRRVFAERAGGTMLRCQYSTPDELGIAPDATRRTVPSRSRRMGGLTQASDYEQLVVRVREVIESDLPYDALALVATRGDDRFLTLDGPQAWHFPRNPDGGYAGYYPSDSDAAVAHLEGLRGAGATHLVFPATAFWWLAYYPGLREHLDAAYRGIRRDEHAIVYDLTGLGMHRSPHDGSMRAPFAESFGERPLGR
jgi:sulfotransferase family protein